MWTQLEPELYFHVELETSLNDRSRRALYEAINTRSSEAFRELYGLEVEVEIFIEEGSLKARIVVTLAAIALFLSQYGGIRSGAEFLASDVRTAFSAVSNTIRHQVNVAEDVSVQRRVGVIGRIDECLRDFESGRISEQECLDRIERLLEIVNASPHRDQVIAPLAQYINTKYGDAIDWGALEIRLPQNAILRQRRRRRRGN